MAIDNSPTCTTIISSRPHIINNFRIALWTVIRINLFNINNITYTFSRYIPFFQKSIAYCPYLYCSVLYTELAYTSILIN